MREMSVCSIENFLRERSLRSERGATMLEGVFALTFLLLFLLVSVDLLWAGFRVVGMQHVVERGLRLAIIPGTTSTAVRASIIQMSRELNVELTNANIHLCPVLDSSATVGPPCAPQVNLGNPGDLLNLRIQVPFWSLLMLGRHFVVTVDGDGQQGILSRLQFPNLPVVVENRARRELPM